VARILGKRSHGLEGVAQNDALVAH
jgi:hypothetical protein